ncbi:YopX protein [Anaerospora hongkongensis]|uniref:YopX protein n=1 Tax=Anaerospora hongkongensis TaxID=244830 RepID=A0A4R1Q215_9FIRM|nr:YopX family protein [Anaerospora hongkongensis]TCL40009.1 YopX protein [Anaerospora hongkongensis]
MQGLYRGKRFDNNEWIYGDLLQDGDTDAFIAERYTSYSDGFCQVFGEAVDPETVGQVLHVLDDTKLYHGDLLHIAIKCHWSGKVIAEATEILQVKNCKIGVEWGHRREFTALSGFTDTTSITLVGNIWDNQELLGER